MDWERRNPPTLLVGKERAGQPRYAVILQDDAFDQTDSITVSAVTADETEAPLFRLSVQPNERNGLRAARRLMLDKKATVPKSKLGGLIGRLDDEGIVRVNLAMLVFLGLTLSPRASRTPVITTQS